MQKITRSQLRRIIRETMDYDPLGDTGVPHVGARPEYALAFVDASYGDRRMELVVRAEDSELARKVMKKMRKQGQVSGVQPTRQRFHPSEVTSREELLRLVSEPLTESAGYEAWVEERGHITPAASSVIASYLVEFGFEPDGKEARRLAQEYGVDLRNISSYVRRERVERAIMGEAVTAPKLPDLDPHYEDGWNDAIVYGEPRQVPAHPPKAVDAYWDGYQDGLDHALRFE